MTQIQLSDNSPFGHPLDPLSRSELLATVAAVRAHVAKGSYAGNKIENALFNSIDLRPPNKAAVLRWAGLFDEEELKGIKQHDELKRQAEVHLICPATGQSFEAIVDLPPNWSGAKAISPVVTKWVVLDEILQPSLQPEELLWSEEICRKDLQVKAACEAVGINQENLYIDGWCIAMDERFPGRRLQQCFAFVRNMPGDNLYAHPCDFIPVIDSHTGEVLAIDYPHLNAAPGEPHPPSSAADHAKLPARERFAPPSANHNYLPELIAQDEPDFKLRDTLKPLHVIQPEGVSYKIEGRVLSWQNWKVHIGFSFRRIGRDGLVLSNITYDDGVKGTRPIIYRLAVAEMVVPYASSTFPHHRKQAFDTGEYGIGALANSLTLGKCCLGSISYFDADFITRAGGIEHIENAICIHEEDAGLLHKHTDFRDNKAHSARNRALIISSIATIANYEYGFYFKFSLDGSIELEVKATGIVNAYPLAPNEIPNLEHEVIVAPRIAAQHHQHLFSLRIDPMIDGVKNRVVQVDSVPDDEEVGSETNFYGNGFKTVKTPFKTSKGSIANYDAPKSRSWAMENPNKQHYATGGNVSYKIVSKDMPPLLAKPGSLAWNRAAFARQNMAVTQYAEDELYPSEIHINQHPGGEDFGLANWIARDDPIDGEDIVVWPCFGVTHISRPEDWPIMPVEILRVHLKPSGFFDRNPGLDVPSTVDPRSRNADEALAQGVNGSQVNGHATQTNGGSCCNGR